MKLIDRVFTNLELKTPSLTTLTDHYTAEDLLDLVKKYEEMLAPHKIEGKRVAILVPAIQEFIPLVAAINKIGGTVIPLSWQFRQGDLLNVLDFLNPHIIFSVTKHTGFDFAEAIEDWAKGKETQTQTLLYTSANCVDWQLSHFSGMEKELEPSTTNFICCSSGSTGTPKGIVFNDKVFDYSFKRLSEAFELQRTDTMLVYASTSTIFGIYSMSIVIKKGATVIVPSEFDLPAIINTMKKSKCNKIATTPSVFKTIYAFAKHLDPEVLENLELVYLTGEKMPNNFVDSFPLMKDCRFTAQYGSSETSSMASANLLKGSEYTLVDGAESKVVDGELLIKTGALFSEYYGNPQLTEEVFDEGWFKTGDLVELLNENTFQIVGRKKELIKKGGQQVIPSEVELLITSLEGVKAVTVLGSPHEIYGEQVVAFVVAKGLTSSDVRSYCKGKISTYKIPDKVIFLDELPLTQGKVDKLELKKLLQ